MSQADRQPCDKWLSSRDTRIYVQATCQMQSGELASDTGAQSPPSWSSLTTAIVSRHAESSTEGEHSSSPRSCYIVQHEKNIYNSLSSSRSPLLPTDPNLEGTRDTPSFWKGCSCLNYLFLVMLSICQRVVWWRPCLVATDQRLSLQYLSKDWWELDVWWHTPVTPHPSPEIWEIEETVTSCTVHCVHMEPETDNSLLQIFCLNSSLPPFLWIVFTVYSLPSSSLLSLDPASMLPPALLLLCFKLYLQRNLKLCETLYSKHYKRNTERERQKDQVSTWNCNVYYI